MKLHSASFAALSLAIALGLSACKPAAEGQATAPAEGAPAAAPGHCSDG